MNDHIKTICLILITLAILIATGFYTWSIWEKQKYLEKCIENCEMDFSIIGKNCYLECR